MNRSLALCLFALSLTSLPGAAKALQCEAPNMLIVQDRSGSMTEGTKWSDAKLAIDYVLTNYGSALRFGLDIFPSDDLCGVGAVVVDVGLSTAAAIQAELLAKPPVAQGGNTPLASSLGMLNSYLPLKESGRRNFVLLVTDGADTCAGGPSTEPPRAAADLLQSGVRTYVIGFGSGVDPAVLSETARQGGSGNYYQASNFAELQRAMDAIIGQALVEVCDNRDNDCDGQTDEDFPLRGTLCTIEQNGCAGQGVYICNPAGDGVLCDAHIQSSPEVCDGVDNDCDGEIDEGFPDADGDGFSACVDCCDDGTEAVVGCRPETAGEIHPGAEEVCNYRDDNCNQLVDESDPAIGTRCGTTDVGSCEYGTVLCLNGKLRCVGAVDPIPEVACDGLDNDCDGLTDEGKTDEVCNDGRDNDCDGLTDALDPDCSGRCQPGQMEACGSDVGDCVSGVRICDSNGAWGPCQGGWTGSEEVCDGRDNDCDGLTDEDDVCGALHECTPNERRECGVDTGECRKGVQICTAGGLWGECAGAGEADDEWCDGRDNDCDGLTDEGHLCPDYDECLCGACATPCAAGECPGGSTSCVKGYCVENPCCGVRCPAGEACDSYGRCVDPCVIDPVTCEAGQVCSLGACAPPDCFTPGHACEAGQRCNAGTCEPDPCAPIVCELDEYCLEGACRPVGCGDCTAQQICAAGICTDSRCAGVPCPPGKICVEGECTADLCNNVACALGETCQEGVCRPDPCSLVRCPAGSRCEAGFCVAGGEQPGEPDAGVEDGGEVGDGGGEVGDDSGEVGEDGGEDGVDADLGQDEVAVDSDAPDGSDTGPKEQGCGCGASGDGAASLTFSLACLAVALRRRR